MELQFHKTQCPCLQQVKWEEQTQEQIQEVRLPDSMPDIGRVLGAWGQVLMRSKEWCSGSMQVSGGVMAWVLYLPEEEDMPQCLEAWIPFQTRWELPDTDTDGTINAFCLLRSVDARSTSARKIMVRAMVSVQGEALVPGQTEICCPENVPEDVQLLKKAYPLCLPVEAGEKPFALDEELILPDTCEPLDRLLRVSFQPQVTDERVMTDKAVFRGQAVVHILYRGQDGQLHCWDFELPFSQYAQLNSQYEENALVRIWPSVTSLEVDSDSEGRLQLKAGMTGQYVVYDCPVLELVTDAYSPGRQVVVNREQLQLPTVLESQTQTFHAEHALPGNCDKLIDAAFYPSHARVQQNAAGAQAVLPGQFQILYRDDSGALQGSTARWEGTWSLSAADDSSVQVLVQPAGKPQESLSDSAGSVRGELLIDAVAMARRGMDMVTGLELGETLRPDPDRPSLIVRRAGEASLWELAKENGSTVDAIRQLNGLEDKLTANQMLLIPIP